MFKNKLPEMIPGQRILDDFNVPVKIARNGNYAFPVFASSNGDEDCYSVVLNMILEGVRDSYLNRCYSVTVPDKVFEAQSPKNVTAVSYLRLSITRAINRISRLRVFDKSDPIEFHMQSSKHSAHIQLLDDRSEGTGIIGHMYIADDESEVVMFGIININPDGTKLGLGSGALIQYASMSAYFLGKKWKNAEKAAMSHKDVCKFGIMGAFEIYLLEYMLYKLLDKIKNDKIGLAYHYLPIETYMFGTVIKDLGVTMEAHTLFTWAHEDDVGKECLPENLLFAPDEVYPNLDPKYPKVDFDPKEWKFASDYCKRNNLLLVSPTNLIPYFTNPRYGNTYLFSFDTSSGARDDMVVTFVMDPSSKVLRLDIAETINESTSIILLADFVNIDEYTPDYSLRKVRKCVMYTRFDKLFASAEELVKASPLLQSDIDNTSALINEVLKFFIIIHDRPERSRMVKGIRHTEPSNTHNKKHSQPKDTTEVVWRVLKPIKAAKEYIQSMSQGGSRNMEYTLEEWERIGHYRTLKSGKQIWIEPTTCRRRDDLLVKDKDIKIKL